MAGDAAYRLTRWKGQRAYVYQLSGRATDPLTGEKADTLTPTLVRLVVKEPTGYARIMRAQATQQTIGNTTFIFWSRDVSFEKLEVEDYIVMDGIKYQVVTSVREYTSIVITAKEVVGVVPQQPVVFSAANSLGTEQSVTPDVD